MKHDVRHMEFIIHYCDNIADAISTFGSDEEDFLNNIHFQQSCAFAIEHIGGSVKQLSFELTSKYTEIEWKDIARFRDLLSHNYPSVNISMVWSAIVNDAPELKKECERILSELKQKCDK